MRDRFSCPSRRIFSRSSCIEKVICCSNDGAAGRVPRSGHLVLKPTAPPLGRRRPRARLYMFIWLLRGGKERMLNRSIGKIN
jgi:hypothetical protein